MTHRKIGHVDPLVVRKIGEQHAVVLVPRVAQVVDVATWRAELETVARRIATLEGERHRLEAKRNDLLAVLAQFQAAPLTRLDGDPEVPLPPAPAEPAPPADEPDQID